MRRSQRVGLFLEHFQASNPSPATELVYNSAFQLLVSVVLSAQCTDKRVNLVTKELFGRYPRIEDIANLTFDELFPFIRSVTYPNSKTKYLIGIARILKDRHGSSVPGDYQALVGLPGVGRKSAHVILSTLFGKPALAVDTHVQRVSRRLGLVGKDAGTPARVEKELVKNIPEHLLGRAHHWLILHGRYVCLARKPKCNACDIRCICRAYPKILGPGNPPRAGIAADSE